MPYKLLEAFQNLFVNGPYLHRSSTNGDRVAAYLFEDLYDLDRSTTLVDRVSTGLSVLNRANIRRGVVARRGDGSFGEIVPSVAPVVEAGFNVQRGPIATIEIGVEVKILAKAMIKQIGRVKTDLGDQVAHFKAKNGTAITVAIVGVNHASIYESFEGEIKWRTDGRKYKHPAQEARDASSRLLADVSPKYDEFLILDFVASNIGNPNYEFGWINEQKTHLDYAASLARITQIYKNRHRE